MITHFTQLQLATVSIPSVRQFYHGQLHLPIAYESEVEIRFQPTSQVELVFIETYEAVAPAHYAFEIPYSEFNQVIEAMRMNGIMAQRWPDGREVDEFETGRNIYFRDGDGHLGEFIAHHYVREDILPAHGPYRIMYLREVGFPVDDVIEFREWLSELLGMKLAKAADNFTFVIGGTAHAVVTSKQRKWIPISMLALPPKMEVTLGVSSLEGLNAIAAALPEESILSSSSEGLRIQRDGYVLKLVLSTVDPELPRLLNLP